MNRKLYKFFYTIRVRYAEVDAQGIVFNAHYLTYFDCAITEYYRKIKYNYVAEVKKTKKDFCIELLIKVGIPTPEIRFEEYPHQWSGGMLQRAAIAMAIRNNPKILLADEPTTALDVTIQDQILALLLKIQENNKMSMILVSHDLGVVAETCDRIAVMYAGRIVELAETKDLFTNPQHPYTLGLINSIPKINSRQEKLNSIPGTLKTFSTYNNKCPFLERCKFSNELCNKNETSLKEIKKNHLSLCLYPERINQKMQIEL